MSTFGTYLFRQTSSALALILLSLCGVVWIALALKELKLLTSKGQDVLTLLTMTSLAIPNLLALIAPVALLVATIHALNRLNSDSELIVVTASGGSIWRVLRPLLALAAVIALLPGAACDDSAAMVEQPLATAAPANTASIFI